MFDSAAYDQHESAHHFHDPATGLRAIVAIHSTALGPGAGGCRMWPYPHGEAALRDALRLSQGMSFKNAIAGLPLGGAKAVILGDPRRDKTPELFEAFGAAVETLGGRYWSAEDVGVGPADMAHAAKKTRYIAGLTDGAAASGDPSPVTARGVYLGVKTACARVFGTDDLSARSIAVQGVGHVGADLARRLAADGASLILADVNVEAVEVLAAELGATVCAPDAVYDQDVDVFSPCALGAVVNQGTLSRLRCKVIAGAANNQLIMPEMGELLRRRGVLYAPDYVINGGGIINVAAEIAGRYDPAWVEGKLLALNATLGDILDEALSRDLPPGDIADARARAIIAAARS